MTSRTELWVEAMPPSEWYCTAPDMLEKLPSDGTVAIRVSALTFEPERFPGELNRRLQQHGRTLDAVVVGANALDLDDGLPLDVGVGAHRRAAWFEVADAVDGDITPQMSRLQPGIASWIEHADTRWDPHRSDRRAAWVGTLAKRTSSAETLLLEAHRPLDPAAFLSWMMDEWPGVERAVGFVWTADKPDVVVRMERAGQHPMVRGAGIWWVASPSRYWPRDRTELERMASTWHSDFGDRICRIAVVGHGFDAGAIQASFEQALISKHAAAAWRNSAITPNPFDVRSPK